MKKMRLIYPEVFRLPEKLYLKQYDLSFGRPSGVHIKEINSIVNMGTALLYACKYQGEINFKEKIGNIKYNYTKIFDYKKHSELYRNKFR